MDQIKNLRKPNFLITSKYAANSTELKCTYMAMYKLQNSQYTIQQDGVIVRLSCEELEGALGVTKSALYKRLSRTAPFMTGRTIGMNNEVNHEFEYITFINKVSYKNGVLTMRFPVEIMEILEEIRKDYTNLPQKILLSYEASYTMKLYEFLKMKCFYPKYYSGSKDGVFVFLQDLAELKFMLGALNSDDPAVKRVLLGSTNPDYTEASLKAKDQLCAEWAEFRRRCLDPAVKEINENEISDITVSYEPKRNGKGSKITDVEFKVTLKDFKEPVVVADQEMPDMEFLMTATEILYDLKLSHADILNIAEAANKDCGLLKKLKKEYDKLKKKPENVVGWFVSSIKKQKKMHGEGWNFAENTRVGMCKRGEYRGI